MVSAFSSTWGGGGASPGATICSVFFWTVTAAYSVGFLGWKIVLTRRHAWSTSPRSPLTVSGSAPSLPPKKNTSLTV